MALLKDIAAISSRILTLALDVSPFVAVLRVSLNLETVSSRVASPNSSELVNNVITM